jgi:tetratricopeptide (TPR) repeat protein
MNAMGWLKGLFSRATESEQLSAAEWRTRGNAALQRSDLGEAARCYESGARADPTDPTLRLNLGFVLGEQGQYVRAIENLEQALALRRPSDDLVPDAKYLLARAHAGLKQPAECIRCCEDALAAKPDFAEARQLLADTSFAYFAEHFNARRFAQALTEAERLIGVIGRHPAALGNLAAVQGRLGRPHEALVAAEEALRAEPGNRELIVNYVGVLHMLGRFDEAIAHAREGLRLFPEHPDLHWNLAVNLLFIGEYEEGWKEHEWRHGRITTLSQPRWQGESLEGRSILLYGEQGYGDIIQFLRFVPEIARRAQTVYLRLLRPLEPLQLGLPSNCVLVRIGDAIPVTDYECPLLSLPFVLGTTVATIGAQVPYIHADPNATQQWRKRLPVDRLNIGITWSGNPANLDNNNRSMPLATLLKVADPKYHLVVLQTQVTDADRRTLADHPEVFDAGSELKSFADTAALMNALDLVLTVDTSVAHLAGALGRPLWIMLAWLPDWRWFLEREDCPWYPTARLYRPPTIGDWDSIVARVRQDLAALSKSPLPRP